MSPWQEALPADAPKKEAWSFVLLGPGDCVEATGGPFLMERTQSDIEMEINMS